MPVDDLIDPGDVTPSPKRASSSVGDLMVFHNTMCIVVDHKMEYHNLIEDEVHSVAWEKPMNRMPAALPKEPEFHET
ncbi:hypothetical protein [Paraburkholderia sp.]|uniref:hypothetical protein n=1 Tax=Paraburkholderia sp. TaxID=1926495 RepID=UPI0039E5C3EC